MTQAIRQDGDDVLVFVRAKPRASRSKVAGEREGELEVALCAPPVDGAANVELIQFLSKLLKVPKSRIELERGETSRHKLVRIREQRIEVVLEALVG